MAEWEERSPWAPFGERRGVPGNAVTSTDVTGTIDVADIMAQNGADLLELIGKSLGFAGTNVFIGAHRRRAEIMVCIAPPWADLIAAEYPDIETVQQRLVEDASLPVPLAHAAPRAAEERPGRRQRMVPPRRGRPTTCWSW